MRRNGIFYFRRRWPEKIRRFGAPAFLSVSLRTHVLAEAVKRSADLLSAIEAGKRGGSGNLNSGDRWIFHATAA
ncbi:DUF6538 domain-containing protein [Roseovarius sp. MBR-78]|uniref:DUF6538 domain-containing protein n=1 Tax=Roseovarius sp. MBR-78 TaxID=3156460 RepID=UPI003398E978